MLQKNLKKLVVEEEKKISENKRVPFTFECEDRKKNSFY